MSDTPITNESWKDSNCDTILMTTNQQLVLDCLEENLVRATTPQMRQHVQEQIRQFKAHCAPKPKPTHPAWVDKF